MGRFAKKDLKARLYADIVRNIVDGEYVPGCRLIEGDLAKAFKTSRTPVREVLFALEKDGLVERIPARGARVAPFGADDVEEIYEIRKVLECLCVRSAGRNLKLAQLIELERRLEV
jgi:DNA-binding GntR family transcriptional regulator